LNLRNRRKPMNQHEYTVEFRIFGLDAALITRDLALEPCQTWAEGAERLPGRIDPNMWAYNGSEEREISWKSLEEGLEFVLNQLWPHRQAITGYSQKGARLVWWCGHFYSTFGGGPSLSPALLKRLGEFGVEIFIDNYYEFEGKPERTVVGN
jgi:Domain of unknown function (DUF4279)